MDPQSGEIVKGGIVEQTRRTLTNLDQAVRAAGGTLADVVDVRVFLIDRADAKGMNAVAVENLAEVPGIIASIIEAINVGELDPQLTAAVAEREANFKPKAKKAGA